MPVTESTDESYTIKLKWTFDEAEISQLRAEGERSISQTFGDGCWKLKLRINDGELKTEPRIVLSAIPQLEDLQRAIFKGETSLEVTQKVLDAKDFGKPSQDIDSVAREVLERDFVPFYVPKTSQELALQQEPNVNDRNTSLTPRADEEERPVKRIKVEEEAHVPPTNGKQFTVVEIRDTDYRTFRAMIAYLHSQVVPFYSSSADYLAFENDEEDPIKFLETDFLYYKYVNDYGGVSPVSVYATYRLADAYQLMQLRDLCLEYILDSLTIETAAYELFSPLSLEYPAVQDSLLAYVVENWTEIKKSESFKVVIEKFSAATNGSKETMKTGRRKIGSFTGILESLPNLNSGSTFLFCLSILLVASAASALPTNDLTRLTKRAEDDGGLSKGSKLSDQQVSGIEQLLNRTASYSWEIGTHMESLVEFSFPSLSVYSSDYDKVSPSTSPLPTQVMGMVSYLISQNPPSTSQLQIVRDGSAADPVSIAPFYVLSNYTLEDDQNTLPTNDSRIQGARKPTIEEAVRNQVEAILQKTPRTSDGAISHRSESTELWSDFVYMVPPFLAYYGALTKNTSLLDAAYDQCRLYRQYLLAPNIGLWRHIALGDSPDPGLWSTGNGWAANGMLRVVGALQNSDYKEQYSNQIRDLMGWTQEIVDAAWKQPMRNGLLYNYLNETNSFAECAGTAALSSATFRHSQLSSDYSKTSSLTAAESAYQTVLNSHLSSPQGVLFPVVNPMDYSSQLNNVKSDGAGNVSPEGEAFVLLMESARREWIQGGGDAEGLMAMGTSSGVRLVSTPYFVMSLIATVAALLLFI
ncbi:hypothetical protein JCM5350_004660 [Sporobolomyces pararoseus]